MSQLRSRDINRTSLSIWAPTDPGVGAQNFNIIDLSGYKGSAIKILGIDWGSIIQNTTDRTNFLSQYVALLRNAKIADTQGISTTAPIVAGGTTFSEIIWMDAVNALSALGQKKRFENPLVVLPGEEVMLVLPSPSLSAGITGTIYTYIQIQADVIPAENAQRLGPFTLR